MAPACSFLAGLRRSQPRAENLREAAADGRRPAAELATMAGYAQSEVLRQAATLVRP